MSHSRQLGRTAAQKIKTVLSDLRQTGISKAHPFSVGHVEKRMRDYAKNNGVDIAEGDLYMTVKSITHAIREAKKRDKKAISRNQLLRFPSQRNKMDLYYDGKAFVYTDYKAKFVIHPNYELKLPNGRKRKVNFITATKVVDTKEFCLPKYKKCRR